MIIVAHGIDLVETARIRSILNRHPDRFLDRILTDTERRTAEKFKDPVPHIAGRFAAKEAILKVLGTGWRGQIAWRDMEITNDGLGGPVVSLAGHCAQVARRRGITRILISITHTAEHAAASAIGTGSEG